MAERVLTASSATQAFRWPCRAPAVMCSVFPSWCHTSCRYLERAQAGLVAELAGCCTGTQTWGAAETGWLLPTCQSAECRHHPAPPCTCVPGKTAADVNQGLQRASSVVLLPALWLPTCHSTVGSDHVLWRLHHRSLHLHINPGLKLNPTSAKSLQCLALLLREPDPSYPCLCDLGCKM